MNRPTLVEPATPAAWTDRAACTGRTDTMFPPTISGWPDARAVCARCPVTGHCLGYVLWLEARIGVQEGVWGGLTPSERTELRDARRVGLSHRVRLAEALRRMEAVA